MNSLSEFFDVTYSKLIEKMVDFKRDELGILALLIYQIYNFMTEFEDTLNNLDMTIYE